MLNAIFRPVDAWPGTPTPPADRQRGPFQASYNSTLDLLETELRHLCAQNIVIRGFFTRDQIRNDGWPKGGQNPSAPGMVLTFTDPAGDAYSYPCDTFNWWTSNLRAIALALEALRKVDRYGVTRGGEQYQGFKALPEPEKAARKMRPDEAAAFIASKVEGVSADTLATNQRLFEAMFRLCQQQAHPDAGGAHEDFVQLQEAGAVLKQNFAAQAKAGSI